MGGLGKRNVRAQGSVGPSLFLCLEATAEERGRGGDEFGNWPLHNPMPLSWSIMLQNEEES